MTAGGIDDTLHELSLYIKHGILRLQETWNEIGVNDIEQAEKCESVVSSLRSVLDSLIIGERAWRDCLEEECSELTESCNDHQRVLGQPLLHVDSVALALLSKRDYLANKSKELQEDIGRKTNQIEVLEERKTWCIRKLGLQPDHYPSIQSDNINRVISLLQEQIKEFEEDMAKRTKCLTNQLNELTDLLESLEIDNRTLIGEGLIAEDPDTLLLSDEAIQRRYDMINKYKSELYNNTITSSDLKIQITRLYRLLHLPPEPSISSLFETDCPKPSTIALLRKELERLEEIKEEKLESYLSSLKEEIANHQKLCFQTRCEVSSSSDTTLSRDADLKTSSTDTLDLPDIILSDRDFANIENRDLSNANNLIMYTNNDNVAVLEEELETWESFYRSNREMFEMIRKWKELNDRYMELQTPSPDKYNNRGGSLLQSQKEASKINKEIPKLESKVLSEVDKMVGEDIRINGLSIEDYFLENRATSSLSRLSSFRRSKKKSAKSPKHSSSSEDQRSLRSLSFREKSSRSSVESRTSFTPSVGSRKSLRKRISRDAGLDKVGLM